MPPCTAFGDLLSSGQMRPARLLTTALLLACLIRPATPAYASPRELVLQSVDGLEQRQAQTIAELIQIRLVDGKLTYTTNLPAGRFHFRVVDAPGDFIFFYSPEHNVVTMQWYLTGDNWISLIEIHGSPTSFQISDSVEIMQPDDSLWSMSLVQNELAEDEPERQVMLHDSNGEHSIAANSFPDLRFRAGETMRSSIGPTLVRLGLADLISGLSPDEATQVLSSDEGVDAEFDQTLARLIPILAGEDESARAEARKTLSADPARFIAAVRRLDRSRLSPQVNQALREELARVAPLNLTTAKEMASDIDLLIDLLYSSDLRLRQRAARLIKSLTRQASPIPPARVTLDDFRRVEAFRNSVTR
jgi:hypothetical protein